MATYCDWYFDDYNCLGLKLSFFIARTRSWLRSATAVTVKLSIRPRRGSWGTCENLSLSLPNFSKSRVFTTEYRINDGKAQIDRLLRTWMGKCLPLSVETPFL